MFRIAKPALAAALLALSGLPAFAADIVDPPVVEAPAAARFTAAGIFAATSTIIWADSADSDFYHLRRDLLRSAIHSGSFDFGDLDGAFSLGGGVGYQITNYLRTDLTVDYWFSSDFNGPTSDSLRWRAIDRLLRHKVAWLLLANAYVDLGTYYGFTPYVGAGIGGAHVSWDDLHNTIDVSPPWHEGSDNWRFAWALMAGTCLLADRQAEARCRLPLQPRQWRTACSNWRRRHRPGAGPGFDDRLQRARSASRRSLPVRRRYRMRPVPPRTLRAAVRRIYK